MGRGWVLSFCCWVDLAAPRCATFWGALVAAIGFCAILVAAGECLTAYLVGEGSFTKMLWLRTVPIFPYDPVSIIAGSVRLPFKIYGGATCLGMLPGAIAYNFLADSFGTSRFYMAVVVTILAFGVPLLLWKKGRDINGKKYRD